MKLQRSSKMYFDKWLTKAKKNKINLILNEYASVVNYFIATYEADVPDMSQFDLSYAVYIQKCIKDTKTWLSARMIKNAFSEGYGMVLSARERAAEDSSTYVRPVHRGKKAILSLTNNIQSEEVSTVDFDFNVTLGCIGNKMKISIPLKKHKHWNKLNAFGKRSKSITLTRKYIQFSFEIKTEPKKESGKLLGVDIGINKLFATSDGSFFGKGYKLLLEKLIRKERHSKGYCRTKSEIKTHINVAINNIFKDDLQLVVVEKLKGLKDKMKERRRLSKNIRRFISVWAYRYILNRIEQMCEINRISFRSIPAYNTSITCPRCSHADKGNRKTQENFRCLNCGYAGNADFVASQNILVRFLTGPYCARFKPLGNGPGQRLLFYRDFNGNTTRI